MMQVGLDYTLFIQIIQFLLIVFIANVLILKPVKSTIDARNAKINGLLENASLQLQKVEDSKLAYERKLAAVRTEIADYHRKIREEAGARVEAMLAEAKKSVAASTAESRSQLEAAVNGARKELGNQVKDISDMIYKTISGNAA